MENGHYGIMNGQIPSVPITTLAGISSLTDLLPELPIPGPSASGGYIHNSGSKILYHPVIKEQALSLLSSPNESLVLQLSSVLSDTPVDYIQLKKVSENQNNDKIILSNLQHALLKCNPTLFSSKGTSNYFNSPSSKDKTTQKTNNNNNNNINNTNQIKEEGISSRDENGRMESLGEQKEDSLHKSVVKDLSHIKKSIKTKRETPPPTISLRVKKSKVLESSGSEDEKSSEEEGKKKNKFFRASEKNRVDEKRRIKEERRKRKLEAPFKEENENDTNDGVSCTKTKRSKTNSESSEKACFVPSKKTRKIERKSIPRVTKVDAEELMESNMFIRFNKTLELIFDNMEEVNLQELDSGSQDNDLVDLPPEILIPKYQLSDLASETAKLKNLGAMESIPPERLVKLLTILEINIRDGARVCPISGDEDDDKLWQELANERVHRAADSSLTALYILTSKNMPKRVYMDDVIERLSLFLRFQLNNTIYPSYDPVYKEISKNKNDAYFGSMKKMRSHASTVRDKNILDLYNKVLVLMNMLADLVKMQLLTDTIVLHISSLAVAPFFVEGIPELQLAALKLVTNLFSKYEMYRRLILDDILASIARLPSSKRSLRTYRLNASTYIQMLTALVLQLIQCVIVLPKRLAFGKEGKTQQQALRVSESLNDIENNDSKGQVSNVDRDLLINARYEMAMATAHQFLTVFLKKCGSKNEDIDYRPLFENFVQDLLTTVNTPEWPAAELLLSLLGHVLRGKFKDKSTELSLRISSLDYLGVVAARLRKDAVQSKMKVDVIDSLIQIIKKEEEKDSESMTTSNMSMTNYEISDEEEDEDEKRMRFLKRVLLDYLAVQGGDEDTALLNARSFYICQWYRDINAEGKKTPKKKKKTTKNKGKSKTKKKKMKNKTKKKRSGDSSEDLSSSSSYDENEEEERSFNSEGSDSESSSILSTTAYMAKEKRKDFLVQKILPFGPFHQKTKTLSTHIDAASAQLIVKYLSSKRPFFNSFNYYLKDILQVLMENSTQVRTKALKCMALIVHEDPNVLLRDDMEKGVHCSLMDTSTMVREAAVDLVGKFILHKKNLIEQYYPMISQRILDTGVSVRKRVIKILKDVCIEFPDYEMIPEICGKMIRRINDEEGIRKLVMEVFQNMWFVPVKEKNRTEEENSFLVTRARNIADVVVACRDTGLEWFEQLLQTLFKPREDKDDATKKAVDPPKALILACQQIVDCLIESVLRIEESNFQTSTVEHLTLGSNNRVVACLNTLYLFARIRPQLLVEHVQTLQPYLSISCKTKGDYLIIGYVARTLELTVPLIKHPSELFLSQLEEDAVKLILQHSKEVIDACLSCLGSIVNNVTKNFSLIRDCFNKYYGKMVKYRNAHEANPEDPRLLGATALFRRGLYTVGLLMRHFDFSKPCLYIGLSGGSDTVEEVFETMFYFMRHDSRDIQTATLKALGSVCVRHYNFMLESKLKTLYIDILTEDFYATQHKVMVLNNLENYLIDEEKRMIQQDEHWLENCKKEDLKEMGDVSSGMASTVIQVYLKCVLDSFIHPALATRHAALKVIVLILSQGLVNPVQIVPYLICMSTDPETAVSHAADRELQEIGKKYPMFIYTKLFQGIKLSHKLQMTIQKDCPRGFRVKEGELPSALHGFMYSIMKTTKVQRRALLLNLLKQFDDYSNEPSLMLRLYLADNLAYIPYSVIDEPLFVIHHINIMVSVIGSNTLQSFRESLKPHGNDEERGNESVYDEDLDDDDEQSLFSRLPEDVTPSVDSMNASQGCRLLLVLKDHLKDYYGITEARLSQYSPTDSSKANERPVNRRNNITFNASATVNIIKKGGNVVSDYNTVEGKKKLVEKYLEFKELMARIDQDEEENVVETGVLEAKTPLGPNEETGNSHLTPSKSNEKRKSRSKYNYIDSDTGHDDESPKNKSKDGSLIPKITINLNSRLSSSKTPRQHHKSSNKSHRGGSSSSSHKHKKKKKKKKIQQIHSSSSEEEDDDSESECSD